MPNRGTISAVVLILTMTILTAPAHAAPPQTSTGYFYPLNSTNFPGWLWESCAPHGDDTYGAPGEFGYNKYHIGADAPAGGGTTVYAAGDGKVIYVDGGGAWGPGNEAVLIQHENSDGSKFVGVYGHIVSSLTTGDRVSAGNSIGTVGALSSGAHLHFGIHPGGSLPPDPWGGVELSEVGDERICQSRFLPEVALPEGLSGQAHGQEDRFRDRHLIAQWHQLWLRLLA